jgi:hypothetical protein
MKTTWKKPWTLLFWLLARDKFTPEGGAGPESISRFGPHGFWGWMLASEADSFREERLMEPEWSQFGPGGFWKWLFSSEKFEEEMEIIVHKPRFGESGFFSWLFGSDRPEMAEEDDDPELPADVDKEEKDAL